ncbi:unnamed protein product [Rotaria sordida]|uniref:Uncharacterized protein n=2 Tax=Rotaria sordida TaxID=392033 RepID=A0A813UIA5_9BILA|nr:unnamed protein product [Rotaria sordida]CAF0850398.1 unnamed protein product [Rotaria sordida]CAF3959151.1 unnamed protein product [Rotaria sordida]
MSQQANYDTDDNFEMVNPISPIKNHEQFEVIEENVFETITCKNKSSSSISSNSNQHVTMIEKEKQIPVKIINQSISNNVKQSLENSSSLINTNQLPIRYGVASIIPHDEGFDLKSILNSKPSLPIQTNDLMNILQDEKSKKHSCMDNSIQQILTDNNHDLKSLIQSARQAQQDFINAIHLD